MSMSFSGQVALVTGAANGIGRATAQAFASAGLKVVVSDVDVTGGEQTVDLIRQAGGEALFVRCDVSRDAEVQALMASVIEAYGRLDYAFNNAGIEIEKGRLNEGSEAEFDAIMGVNVKGVWLCMKYQLPLLMAQGGGAIVNTASVAGLVGAPTQPIYAASKHAVAGYSQAVDHELRTRGIRVSVIEPAYTKTQFEANTIQPDAMLEEYEMVRAKLIKVVAQAMEGGDSPEVVAEVVVTAAQATTPKRRYTAGKAAGQLKFLRRFAPTAVLDKGLRKNLQLDTGEASV